MTGRAFAPLLLLGDRRGWDQAPLLEGLGLTEETIRNPSSSIEWNEFVAYCGRFEDRLGGPEHIGELGEVMVPAYIAMARFLGLMTSPAAVYRFINRWAGPNMFPMVSQTTRQLNATTLEIELSLPDTVQPCSPFFRITGVMFRMAPVLVGGRPAAVQLEASARKATYVVSLPPSTTLFARVRRAFLAFFSGAQVLDELVEQHDRLVARHQELHLAHLEVERSEQNFRTVLRNAPVGTLVLGEREIRYANEAMNRFLRLPEGDSLSGRSITGFLAGEGALGRFMEKVESDEIHNSAAIEFRADDGETVVGEVRSINTSWDGEQVRVLVCQDVTERNRVMSRALELDRMIAVGTLAAGVAHEINNPLAYVHSNLEYAVEAFDQVRSQPGWAQSERIENVEQALRESLQGTTRVRDIVRDLKSFSRAPEEILEAVDSTEVCKAAMNMAWHEVRKTAKIRSEFDDVPMVLGNEARLGQVVLNLLVNAAQAFPAGKEDHNFITVRTFERDGSGIIEVQDNGCGISPENLRRIFDPFFTTKPLGEGTGMGLWISQSIVTRLGGTLEVESETNRGTRFRITLPIAPPLDEMGPVFEGSGAGPLVLVPMPGPVEPLRSNRRATRRVMVIDDEPMIGRLVQRILSDEVVTFTEPHKAIRHLRDDDDFDVVLCDSTMPGMTGREFYNRLQHEYPELAARFVLITGGLVSYWQDDPDAPPILAKPFSMNSLRATVKQISDAIAAE